MTVQVHWHEGLFIQPHHFQLAQRHAQAQVWSERRRSWAYPYGVVEARLSTDELENMRVRFDRLRVVLPGGREVSVPEDTDLPALDITERFAASTRPLTVGLGVPLWYPTRANALEPGQTDWRVKRPYRVAEEAEVADENTGENRQPVLVRRLNARLVLDGDDTTDLEVLPLLRVMHGAGDDGGVPRLDGSFVPPCLLLSGSPTLREMLRDLANQVEAARADTMSVLTRAGFTVETLSGVRVQQMLRLTSLNRASGRLMAMIQASGGVCPLDVYLELRGLLGELAALQPDRDAWESMAYDHDDPGPVFSDLCERVRSVLRPEGTATWLRVELAMREGVYRGELTEEHLTKPNEYFLGIRTGKDPRALAKLVEDENEFKFIAASMAQTRVRGVRLREERHPPLQLPASTGLHYFRVMRAETPRMWEKIVAERSVAVNFTGIETAGFDAVSLYMTVPD